jgi:hypothetical protein
LATVSDYCFDYISSKIVIAVLRKLSRYKEDEITL